MKDIIACKELKHLTPEIIRAWNEKFEGNIFLTRRLVFCRCVKTKELVSEQTCLNCRHNFGSASPREFYCVPNTQKIFSRRTERQRQATGL